MENENTFIDAAKEAARIMARSTLKTYRITYTDGTFLTYWSGASAEHAVTLTANYYHILPKQLVARLEQ